MFLLDTNVISELRRPARADPALVAWASTQPATSRSCPRSRSSKLSSGLGWSNAGIVRKARSCAPESTIRSCCTLKRRILAIDTAVALRCAGLHVPDRRPERDALIAATAAVHGLTVVTRNIADFEPMGVAVINPWTAA